MLTIDRIENGIVIVSDGSGRLHISSEDISGSFGEGDVLVRTKHGYQVDKAATKAERERIIGLQNSHWE